MLIIVTYQHRDMQREAERDFTEYAPAWRLANSCIEDGGHAHMDVYLSPAEPAPARDAWDMADVYIHRDEVEQPCCQYCSADPGNCNC